jgi:hypothetical protein
MGDGVAVLCPIVVGFVGVLAEGWWGAADGETFAVHEDRGGDHPEGTGRGMVQALQDPRGPDVLVGEHIGEGVDGAARDA